MITDGIKKKTYFSKKLSIFIFQFKFKKILFFVIPKNFLIYSFLKSFVKSSQKRFFPVALKFFVVVREIKKERMRENKHAS